MRRTSIIVLGLMPAAVALRLAGRIFPTDRAGKAGLDLLHCKISLGISTTLGKGR